MHRRSQWGRHERGAIDPGNRPRPYRGWGATPLVAVLLLGLATATARADARPSEAQALEFIGDLASRAATVLEQPGPLEQREQALRRLLRGGFEIPLIARFALGKYWRDVSPSDQDTYVELFGEFLLRTYASKLAAFDRDKLEVLGAAPRGERDMVVQTQILQPSGPPIKAGWRVRLFEGEPRIVDIVIEGVSMVFNQRQEFAAVLTRGGIGQLMEMLRARTERLPVEGPEAARTSQFPSGNGRELARHRDVPAKSAA